MTGNWGYTYDNLNHLTLVTGNAGSYMGNAVSGVTLGWECDPFGNRSGQTSSSPLFPTAWIQYSAYNNNQIASTNAAVGGVDQSFRPNLIVRCHLRDKDRSRAILPLR